MIAVEDLHLVFTRLHGVFHVTTLLRLPARLEVRVGTGDAGKRRYTINEPREKLVDDASWSRVGGTCAAARVHRVADGHRRRMCWDGQGGKTCGGYAVGDRESPEAASSFAAWRRHRAGVAQGTADAGTRAPRTLALLRYATVGRRQHLVRHVPPPGARLLRADAGVLWHSRPEGKAEGAHLHQPGGHALPELLLGRARRLARGPGARAGREPDRDGQHPYDDDCNADTGWRIQAVFRAGVRHPGDHEGARGPRHRGLRAHADERQLSMGSVASQPRSDRRYRSR